MKTIAERIKEGLKLRDMKQADLVEKTGIGKSSISTYITGSYEPKQRNIYKIAQALNVNEAWLMGYDVPMERENSKFNIEQDKKDEIENPDIRMIARAGKKMTAEQAELLRRYAEFTFPEAFKKDGD